VTITPGFVFSLYLLVGLGFYFWSEPYRPQSAAAFDHCFRASRLVWVLMVFIASCFWPVFFISMTYRFLFVPKKDKDGSE